MRVFFVLLQLAARAVAAHRYIILRHGETDHNAAGIIQGSSDVSRLTAVGVRQARVAGETLAALEDVHIGRVYASPLARAQQTYAELARVCSLPVAVSLSQLREVDLGRWEARPKTELRAEMPEEYRAWSARPLEFTLDGERPIVNVWARARDAWELMRRDAGGDTHGDGVTLVVTHNVRIPTRSCTAPTRRTRTHGAAQTRRDGSTSPSLSPNPGDRPGVGVLGLRLGARELSTPSAAQLWRRRVRVASWSACGDAMALEAAGSSDRGGVECGFVIVFKASRPDRTRVGDRLREESEDRASPQSLPRLYAYGV